MGKYDDILRMPRPVSTGHPRMSVHDRAAQFSPFRALTGYEDTISETVRLTDSRIELDESVKAALDERLRLVAETIQDAPVISITYFQPDQWKVGGAYLTVSGTVKKILEFEKCVIMENEIQIPIEEIVSISGRLFSDLE